MHIVTTPIKEKHVSESGASPLGLLPHVLPLPPSLPLSLSLSFGGRYYVIVGGIEHKSRGSSGPMNY